MFSSYLTLFPSLDSWIKQCQEDFDITQIYQLNLETVQLEVLRFLPHKGVTILTMRKVASMALWDTWHTFGRRNTRVKTQRCHSSGKTKCLFVHMVGCYCKGRIYAQTHPLSTVVVESQMLSEREYDQLWKPLRSTESKVWGMQQVEE